MKLFIPVFALLALVGCKAKTTELLNTHQEFKRTTNCPEEGHCKVELIPNSSLEVLTDKFDAIYTNINK